MSWKETIFCDLLDWHNYTMDRHQDDFKYVWKTCSRCGDKTCEPR